MNQPVAYLMENEEAKWLGWEPDPQADWVTPLYKEKWKIVKDCTKVDRAFAEVAPSGMVEMKKHNISVVVTVGAETKKEAKEMIIRLMNRATSGDYVGYPSNAFPEWGFHSEYKLIGEKVKK